MIQKRVALSVPTRGRGFTEITGTVREAVRGSGVATGIALVFVRHTSASLCIQENADPAARGDMERFLERLAPEGDPAWRHVAEGPDDAPSHLRSLVTRTSETILVAGGDLDLGTWQGIFLCEHRAGRRTREVLVHVLGE
jgi:secondary thiamine-phosphate synthase enzyme